jgi:hypothetical protein
MAGASLNPRAWNSGPVMSIAGMVGTENPYAD